MCIWIVAERAQAQPAAEPDAARAALRAGELERALDLAQQAVSAQPHDVDALTVLGMVLAKRGDAEGALAQFDAALAHAGGAASAGLLWNRASCLAALERSAEAERAFLAAAERAQDELAALCWLNAGFAALDAGSAARARAHLQRARELDHEHALGPELADLETELGQHDVARHAPIYALLTNGELARAQQALERMLAEQPEDAVAWYLAGIVAYRQQRHAPAERQLKRALALGLDAERTELAHDYLDLIAGGAWLAGRGLHADLELGGGYDSNAVQAGLGDNNPLLASEQEIRGGAYGRARAELSYGLAPADAWFVVARYALEQIAYAPRELDVWNAQQHELVLEAERRAGGGLRFAALAHGAFEAAGLADLRAFALTGGGELGAALEHDAALRTRIAAGAVRTAVIDDAYAFLSGTRLQLAIDLRYQRGALRAGIGASYRTELLGTEQLAAALAAEVCSACSASYAIPLGYHGPHVSAWLSYRALPWLRAGAHAAGELRAHASEASLVFTAPDGDSGELWRRRERDARLILGAGLSFELSEPLALDLDYELTVARSNIDHTLGGEHTLDYASLSFTRHLLSLALVARF